MRPRRPIYDEYIYEPIQPEYATAIGLVNTHNSTHMTRIHRILTVMLWSGHRPSDGVALVISRHINTFSHNLFYYSFPDYTCLICALCLRSVCLFYLLALPLPATRHTHDYTHVAILCKNCVHFFFVAVAAAIILQQ